ncbi:hypothetical protein, partial [Thalassospira sp. UBA1131]|uniref:hypothetical protein n=1 Tax=Thalassospira sp. UBA1131 TaxID=1947672 RepID=UPI0025E37B28
RYRLRCPDPKTCQTRHPRSDRSPAYSARSTIFACALIGLSAEINDSPLFLLLLHPTLACGRPDAKRLLTLFANLHVWTVFISNLEAILL